MWLPQRLELEIEADLYERIEEISIRSGRSICKEDMRNNNDLPKVEDPADL